jgi:hypothetical protein
MHIIFSWYHLRETREEMRDHVMTVKMFCSYLNIRIQMKFAAIATLLPRLFHPFQMLARITLWYECILPCVGLKKATL